MGKKFLLFFTFCLSLFAGCSGISGNANIDVVVDKVIYKDLGIEGTDNILEFYIYFGRPDQSIKQPQNTDGLLTSDLPPELQPKVIYANGTMCDVPRFPHDCRIPVTAEELKNGSGKFLIDVTFVDGAHSQKEITVPYPTPLAKPYITEPKSTPSQKDTFRVKFTDVGADYYDVGVSLCGKYEDDGINPCLDGISYRLVKDGDDFFAKDDSLYSPDIVSENGVIEVMSDFVLMFEDSVQYFVTAGNGSSESNDMKAFSAEN
ncbi:MAG: hypothetical protein ABIH78_04935 [Candidatus Peregrinibacteria bacterium]